MRLVLGSASPRRRELLGLLVKDFDILVPDVDESIHGGEDPYSYCLRVSEMKSSALLGRIQGEETLLVTADTTVILGTESLGKPENFEAARAMLTRLSGVTHEVATAMTLTHVGRDRTSYLAETEITRVTFKVLDREAIERYLSLIEWSDKAGGYAVQEYGRHIIDSVDGSLSNVIGFPLRRFLSMLGRLELLEKLLTNHGNGPSV